MSIRILITDDHAAIREQLKSVLGKQTDLEVVAEADDGQSAVKLAKELVPNVVLMDLAMPKMNGIEATRNILRENASIRIIMNIVKSPLWWLRSKQGFQAMWSNLLFSMT